MCTADVSAHASTRLGTTGEETFSDKGARHASMRSAHSAKDQFSLSQTVCGDPLNELRFARGEFPRSHEV